jgi:hypothetical protein
VDGVRWLETGDDFELGYWVLFARGLGPEELLRRLGGTPEPAELTRVQASDLEGTSGGVVMRAGSSGEWAFGVAEYGSPRPDAVAAVSAGTVAVELSRTVNYDTGFAYAEDGRTLCGFEPGMQRHRTGADPDRLLPALRAAGLVLPDGSDEDAPDATERALAMAEAEFGLSLPRQAVLDGALAAALLPD